MENKPNNPDAFPSDTKSEGYTGMSLRDYFATAAMQGMVTKYGKPDDYNWQYGTEDTHDVLAKKCYKIADAMLKQREL
jgi:hypothetical protein